MRLITNRKFSSPLSAGVFFGFLSTAISVLTFNLPLPVAYVDFICAAVLLLCVIAAVYFIVMMAETENFYRLFVSSFLTFCIAIGGMVGYLSLIKGEVQAQWLTLLSGGAVVCFAVAFLASVVRRKKSV